MLGDVLVSSSANGSTCAWNWQNGKQLWKHDHGDTKKFEHDQYNHVFTKTIYNGKAVVGLRDGSNGLYDVRTGMSEVTVWRTW